MPLKILAHVDGLDLTRFEKIAKVSGEDMNKRDNMGNEERTCKSYHRVIAHEITQNIYGKWEGGKTSRG